MKKTTARTKPAAEQIVIQPPEESVGYLISATYRLLNRALQAQVAGLDVPAGTWIFLRTIWEEDGLTQREISQRVGIQEAATGFALDKLARLGLIERTRNAKDRRKISVCLTERGRELGRELIPKSDELTNQIVAGFEHFEVAQLCSYLARVRKNLQAIAPASSAKDDSA